MRNLPLPAALFLFYLGLPVQAQEPKYSVRDVGFVEVEPRPYRLVLLAKDPSAPAVKKQQASLQEELHNSNIVLVQFPTDPKNVTPVFQAIKVPDKQTAPPVLADRPR